MKKVIIWLIILLSSILIVTAQREPAYFYKLGDTVDNIFQCTISDGSYCQPNYECNLTLTAPNTSVVINNQAYTNNINYHNYTLNSSILSIRGDYKGDVCCTNLSAGSCSSFFLRVNDSGNEDNLFLNLGVFFVFIAVSCIYIFAAFKIDEEKFFVKVVLLFVAFGNVAGLLLSSILIYTNYYEFIDVAETLFYINIIVLITLLFAYFYYIVRQFIKKITHDVWVDEDDKEE